MATAPPAAQAVLGVPDGTPMVVVGGTGLPIGEVPRALERHHGAVVIAVENALTPARVASAAADGAPPWRLAGADDALGTVPDLVERAVVACNFRVLGRAAAYPAAATPRIVIAGEAFAESDAARFIDQLTHGSLIPPGTAVHRVDLRGAHRRLLAAGVGPAAAPGVLLLVAPAGGMEDGAAVTRPTPEGTLLAVREGSGRRTGFLQTLEVRTTPEGGRRIHRSRPDGSHQDSRVGPLTQRVVREDEYLVGPTLEQCLVDALTAHRWADAAVILGEWGRWLRSRAAVATTERDTEAPYGTRPGRLALPEDHLDPQLDNLVRIDGECRLIDTEWVVHGGCDLDTVALRAAFRLSIRLLDGGVPLPDPAATTVAGITRRLLGEAGFDPGFPDERTFERLLDTEAALMGLVGDVDPVSARLPLAHALARRVGDEPPPPRPVLAALEHLVGHHRAAVTAARRASLWASRLQAAHLHPATWRRRLRRSAARVTARRPGGARSA